MSYLFLAIAFQVANSVVLKQGEVRGQNRLVVMERNYLTASILGGGMWWAGGGGWPGTATVILSVAGGVFYAASLLLWMMAIRHSGLGTATAAMRMSVLWPTLVSFAVFGERPNTLQWVGMALAFSVLLLLAGRALPGRGGSALGRPAAASAEGSGVGHLLALFVVHGGTGLVQKLFTEVSNPQERPALLALIFMTAWGVTLIAVRLRPAPASGEDHRRGVIFGVLNLTTNFLILLGLVDVPGVVAFPLMNCAVLLLATLAGVALWRERPGRSGMLVIVLAAGAVTLLTMGGV
ncbi:MAG: hypothetical protein OEW39_11935 [Deltaproteobacteria bacterium]|nr:hypothetical protein [Deltaproteobacteria bacterium]